MSIHALCLCVCVVCVTAPALAQVGQQLLDRVLVRVNGHAITLTDERAARGLGLIETPSGDDEARAAKEQLIDRELILAEVARFPPREPDATAIAAQAAELKAHAGAELPALVQSTGLDDQRIGELARDTLRIRAYLDQRFGTTAQVSDREVEDYFREHPQEFQKNGAPMPFTEAEPLARERAGTQRRTATIAQWLRDLRRRADIAEPLHSITAPQSPPAGSRAN